MTALFLALLANVVVVQSVDRVIAFSDDGRSALIERVGAVSGGGSSRAYLLVSLDHAPQRFSMSQVGVGGRIAVQTIDAAQCRGEVERLERAVDDDFFGSARIDVGACARGRTAVDVRRPLRVRPLPTDELEALLRREGPGHFVAAPNGPLVVHLAGDLMGNVTFVGVTEAVAP
jgi:hypothetical protein